MSGRAVELEGVVKQEQTGGRHSSVSRGVCQAAIQAVALGESDSRRQACQAGKTPPMAIPVERQPIERRAVRYFFGSDRREAGFVAITGQQGACYCSHQREYYQYGQLFYHGILMLEPQYGNFSVSLKLSGALSYKISNGALIF